MKLKYAVPALMCLIFAPTAALADTYYVVQDKKTMKCKVVKEKPDEVTLLGINLLGLEFSTEVEANESVKTSTVCVKE